MKNICFEFYEGGGEYFVTNEDEASCEPRYACVTAPVVIKVRVTVDGTLVDQIWAGNGGSHSWWKEAGGGLLKYPLKPGQTLGFHCDGECAVRIDWY